jgi:hypothetical protein
MTTPELPLSQSCTLKNGWQVYSSVPRKNGCCQVDSSVIQGGYSFVKQAHLQFP